LTRFRELVIIKIARGKKPEAKYKKIGWRNKKMTELKGVAKSHAHESIVPPTMFSLKEPKATLLSATRLAKEVLKGDPKTKGSSLESFKECFDPRMFRNDDKNLLLDRMLDRFSGSDITLGKKTMDSGDRRMYDYTAKPDSEHPKGLIEFVNNACDDGSGDRWQIADMHFSR
jgi:hypothetical protein